MPIWITPYLIESLNSRMAVLHDWPIVLPSLPRKCFHICPNVMHLCIISVRLSCHSTKTRTSGHMKRLFSPTAISSDINFCKTDILFSSLDLPLSVEFWQSENVPLIWNIGENHENSARPQALWLSGVTRLKNIMKLICAWNRGIWNTWREITHFKRYIAQKVNKDSQCLYVSNLESSETSRTCCPNTSENLVHSSFTNIYWTSIPDAQFLIHHTVPGVVARVVRSSEDTWISELSGSTGCP